MKTWSQLTSDAPQYLRQFTSVAAPSPDKDSGLHPPIICLFRLSDFLMLDVAPSLLLVLTYGTIYLRTLYLFTVAV